MGEHDARYLDDVGPGSGRRRPARSWLHSDAPTESLGGAWRFRLLRGAPGTLGAPDVLPPGEAVDAFAEPAFDDTGWDSLTVPGHWVLQGDGKYGSPQYTNVQLPFPQDPPFSPDENPTGDHRRTFDLPTPWVDRAVTEAVVLRFDGVESRYRVWVNGVEIGVGTGSRLAQEFDVTDAVRAGTNTIAVRVHQWSASTYVEDQDQWWLPGIFRDVTLQARPVGGIEDVWLRAEYDHESGTGRIVPEVRAGDGAFPVRLSAPGLDVDVVWTGPGDVAPVEVGTVAPWTAEQPLLHDVRVTSAGGAETIDQRIGFRTVSIVGDRFLVNGRRVVLHGMNRHDTHPDLGRGFDEAFVRRDLALMKQHNVNAIRTAHYPPHPRVLDLADELGFWVVLECDVETHAFHHGGSGLAPGVDEWLGNPSDDPAWHRTYLDRIERTVERDKNHPSVVMWSLGNESGTGANLAAMADWVHARDPERPVHYEGDRAGAYADVYSRMYASIAEVTSIGDDSTAALEGASVAESVRQRTKPFLLCEYVHAMGNGPGGIDRYEDLVDRFPRLHGGFVWEWRDHGIRSRTPEGTEFFAHGGDFDPSAVNDGKFCMDGMVLSDGTPTPGLVEFAAVAAPIRFGFAVVRRSSTGTGTRVVAVTVSNTRHSADASDLVFPWRVELDGVVRSSGVLSVTGADGGPLAAGDATVVELEVAVPTGAELGGETWLTVSAALAGATPWAGRGHVVAAGQHAVVNSASRPTPTRSRTLAETGLDPFEAFALGPATFRAGYLSALCDAPVDGPRLELWRAPTDNDAGSHMGSYDESDPMAGRGLGVPGPSHASAWRETGLDRLRSRVIDLRRTDTSLQRTTRWAAADTREAVTLEERWQVDGEQVVLDVSIVPSARWRAVWPRIGVRFDLPVEVDRARWFGTGPGESYPDSRRGVLVGRYEAPVDQLTFPYAVPQESGHRSDLRQLDLAAGDRDLLRVDVRPDTRGRLPGFTLARHTPQQVDRAGHQHELPVPERTYLFVDAAQNGLGSRACGPDVWPDALLRSEARTLHLRFSAR
ncbi:MULTISPECIES: glycoside hydrolase family 2 TIM barrel-domain containing protein [unclassified Curtobacterium]|uniref:glycoside hydrolase family 2 TIM barrel-domain containing protein n=1 Tax=unclassified Curtobacterium TaxID=257496 RepID=UPI0008DDD573|nr:MULTISPECIES: glycoside hydrolase family 2 TIM barrel-domain containing protein [unclassified Curtobacterium]OIH98548.1 beta-galactosidase [Curtobacterium sp. MCBA15_003]OII12783.1 beta-galactosidase [Curtobacterium sp. MCBA15_009]OII32273.1 beta-galactosidase [Curtobacterium sp. MMLR14_006]